MPVPRFHAGAEVTLGVLMALWQCDRTGAGQHVDVSLQELMLMPNMTNPAQAWQGGQRGQRSGNSNRVRETVQQEIWPCKDGFVSFALRGGPARIPGLIAMTKYVDEAGMASPALSDRDWTGYNHNLLTQAEVDEIAAPLGEVGTRLRESASRAARGRRRRPSRALFAADNEKVYREILGLTADEFDELVAAGALG